MPQFIIGVKGASSILFSYILDGELWVVVWAVMGFGIDYLEINEAVIPLVI